MMPAFDFTPEAWVQLFNVQHARLQDFLGHTENVDTDKCRAGTFMSLLGFTTDGFDQDAVLAPRWANVLQALLDGEGCAYMDKGPEHTLDYLIVCNLPRIQDHLEWGVSIRWASFKQDRPCDMTDTLPVDCPHRTPANLTVRTRAQYEDYVRGLIAFVHQDPL